MALWENLNYMENWTQTRKNLNGEQSENSEMEKIGNERKAKA